MPPKSDLVFHDAHNVNETDHPTFNVEVSPTKPDKDLSHTHRPSTPIIEDWVSDSEDDSEAEISQNVPSFVQPTDQVKTPRSSKTSIPADNHKTTIPKPKSTGNHRNIKACFVCKSLDHLIKDCDFYEKKMAQPPVWNHAQRENYQQYTRMTLPNPQRHVVPTVVLTKSKLVPIIAARPVTAVVPKPHVTRPRQAKTVVTKPHSPPRRTINRSPSPKASAFPLKVTAAKTPMVNVVKGNWVWKPKRPILDHVSRNTSASMTLKRFNYNDTLGRSKSVLAWAPKRNSPSYFLCKSKIVDMFPLVVLQGVVRSLMCDKKKSVLFNDTECLVLSPKFKLPDENQVLLRVSKENNMYNVDLKNIVSSRDLTCLFAKATLDEFNLWHRRLGYFNFKTMNKLVKGNLVRGLPTQVFENNHTCVACKKCNNIEHLVRPSLSILSVNPYKDDYSRFTWVFFLATKDRTSHILKAFITGIKNQLSLKVKIIKSDNKTKFKNNDLNQFCGMKGIKREISVPRTPQQNGITERKNRTLIEAARTMLKDSLLPIPFWAETVNTACYVQNRVLVTKPQNKTPYELLLGRTPSIGFMRHFGCLVTIHNTLDPLGKFDGKVDEGFLVGYSVSSSGPTWLFDIDTLTKTMNYQPLIGGNQSNPSAGVQEQFDVEKAGEKSVQQYVLFPVCSSGSINPQNTDDDAAFGGKKHEYEVHASPSSSAQTKKHDEKTKREAKGKSPVESLTGYRNLSAEFEGFSNNSINEVKVADSSVPAVGQISTNSTNTFSVAGPSNAIVSPTHGKSSYVNTSQYLNDPNMPELEDITYSDDKEDVGTEADFTNLETTITVSPIPITRVHKAHPMTQIIGDLSSATQTRSRTRVAKDQGGLSQINNDDFHTYLGKAFEKLMKDKFQMSSMGELTFFLVLQEKQKQDGIFISKDKYLAEILRKFGLTDGKSASTPIDTEKPLLKDPDESLSPQVVSAAKLPILNPNESDFWKMRIKQYFLMTDYSLWEVILNGDSPAPTRVIEGVVQPVAPTTVEQRLARKNELKAHGTLLMALPDKHQLKFNIHKDAKTLMEAIEKRNLGANGPTSMGFDMSKVECYNCHMKGHFVREYRSPKDTKRNGAAERQRRNVPVETSTSNALVSQCDGVGSYDWSFQAEEEPTNYALMAFTFSSSLNSDNEVPSCLKAYTKAQKFKKAEQKRDDLKLKLEKFWTSSKNLIQLLASQTNDKTGLGYNTQVFTSSMFDCDEMFNSGDGYHAVPLPYTGTFMLPKLDLVFYDAHNVNETDHPALNVEVSPTKPDKDLSQTHRPSTPIIEDWVSYSEDDSEAEISQNVPSFVQPTDQVKTPRSSKTSIPADNHKTTIPKPKSTGNHRNRKACFVCKSLDHLIKDYDFHEKKMAQPPVRNHAHRENHQPVTAVVPKPHVTRPRQAKTVVTKPHSPPRRTINRIPSPKASTFPPKVTAETPMVNVVKGNWEIQVSNGLGPKEKLTILFFVQGNLQHALKDKGVIDSECSRHMTGNMSYLFDFEELNGGYVTFGGTPRGGKIFGKGKIKTGKLDFDDVYFVKELKFNLFSVSQMCDKKNSVLFTDTECLILSPKFKLPDENQVLLRVCRENNMYNVDLKNIVSSRDLTCLFAEATLDKFNLWHRRLGHINFKTMNKLNRVLVTKPQNKTPYELLLGRTPSICFMRPFGCLVTILNTLDPLGKFDRKVDEGSGPTWLFDIDTLTKTMNYQPLIACIQSNPSSCVQEQFDAEKAREKSVQQYVLFPVCSSGSINPQNTDDDAAFGGKKHEYEVHASPSSSAQTKKHDEKTKREAKGKSLVESLTGYRNLSAEFEDFFDNSINEVNAIDSSIPAVRQISTNNTNTFSDAGPSNAAVSPTHRKSSYVNTFQYPNDPNMSELEDITYSDDEEDVGADADFTNLETTITEELLQFKMQKIWVLVDLPHGKQAIGFMVYQIDVKSAFLYGTIMEEVYVCQPSGFEDPDYPNKKQDRIFISQDKYLAEILRKFGLTDRKSASTLIDTEKPLLKNPDGEDVDVHTYRSIIGSLMYLTSSRPDIMFAIYACAHFKVTPKASHLHAVKRIFRYLKGKSYFGLWYPKDSPFNLVAYTDSDYACTSLDRKSTTRGCQFLGCILISCAMDSESIAGLWVAKSIMKSLKSNLHVTNILSDGYITTPQMVLNSPWLTHIKNWLVQIKWSLVNDVTRLQALVDKKKVIITEATIRDDLRLNDAESIDCLPNKEIFTKLSRMGAQVGDLSLHSTKYSSPALTQKVFANMKRVGKGFFGVDTPLFEGMIVAQQVDESDAEVNVDDVLAAGVADEGAASVNVDDAKISMDLLHTLLETYTTLTRRVEHLEQDKMAQSLEIIKLKQRVKKLKRRNKLKVSKLRRLKRVGTSQRVDTSNDTVIDDVSKQGRIIADMDADKDGRQAESQAQIYQINLEYADKVLSMQDDELEPADLQKVVKVVTTAKLITEVVTAASATITAADTLLPAATITAAAPILTTAPSAARRRK
nr:hypothetical protein [Tanacetum cinerariifolium]